MKYKYDSWNRIQKMTYPDGEVVTYGYNQGGMLKSVVGNKNGVFSDYIKEIHYNKYELKDTVTYGNGTGVRYMYDSILRLSHLRSECAYGTMQDIVYAYDSVSNITGIVNSAAMLSNGLGGVYSSSYTYDNLYRLAYADGNWQGNNTLHYETFLEYEKNGRISRKVLYADTWLDGNYATENYDNEYHYVNTSQPNTLSYINGDPDQSFEWDLKGNMVFHQNGSSGYERSLCWDEQNRLLGVVDDEQQLSYYLYDANGDRVYKLTGNGEPQNISGEWRIFYNLNNATLYASPYLVATKQGYTKHYYAETERIASRIGGGRLRYLDQPVVGQGKIVEKQSTNKTYAKEVLEECLDAIHSEGQADLHHLYDMINSAHSETDCYWYHPDHLGSSSWITDSAGTAVQHLHYLPWGEDFVNQRTTSFNSMYTFSAKEKDSETGLSYFGSRYYSSDLSVWLSVDPMSDKYASLSPYVYCADNPVKLVDPNGEDTIFVNKKTGYSDVRVSKGNDIMICGSNKVTLSGHGVFAQAKGNENQSNDSQILLTGLSKKDAVKVFNFMADNTNFEWGFLEISEGDISSYIVGSAYESDVETLIYDQALNAKPGSVVCYDHSHWDNNTHWGGFPSTSETSKDSNNNDISAWKKLLLNNPKATLGIRFKNKTVPYVIEGYAPQRYYRLLLEQ